MSTGEAKLEQNKTFRQAFQKQTGLNQHPHQWFSYENHNHIGGEQNLLKYAPMVTNYHGNTDVEIQI